MNDKVNGEYTVHTVTYMGKYSSEIKYRGRVMSNSGWWKVSKDFDRASEAEAWCLSKLRERCISDYVRVPEDAIVKVK